jgi:ABC-type microcin C transport system duplicated ATPase subunit YejF
MSILADVVAGLKSAIQLEERVKGMAANVSDMAREVRDIDKRLVRVETVIEVGLSGRGGTTLPAATPLLLDDSKERGRRPDGD